MALEHISFALTGLTPLILHNGTYLSDPLSAISKELKIFSGKMRKTDEDHQVMRDLEFLGSLYTDQPLDFTRSGSKIDIKTNGRLIMPGENIWRMLYDAALFSKFGPRVKQGVLVLQDSLLEGGESLVKMFRKPEEYMFRRRVKLGGKAAVMRTRCILRQWALTTQVSFQPDRIDHNKVIEIMETAGKYVGLTDWRPRYGTFEVKVASS